MRQFKDDKFFKIIASNNSDSLELYYQILDTNLCDRWIGLINKNLEKNNSIKYNYRKILNDDEINLKFLQFQSNIDYINYNYDKILPRLINLEHLKENQNILNDLHEEYEIYGDRLKHLLEIGYFSYPKKFPELFHPVWPGNKNYNNKDLHNAFLLLNEQIHNFEAIFRNWGNREKTLCSCLFDFLPNKPTAEIKPEDYLHENLKPEDYFLFSSTHLWGWAYLGYNTLGKHWSSACNENDTEVVLRKQVRPQQRFAAETYLTFSLKDEDNWTTVNFYNWWVKNNFSDVIDPDSMRLKDFALGYIPVAKLWYYTINNENRTYINKNCNHQDWNTNVWSKFNSIKGVKIV